MDRKLRIVFMGTPDFAVPSLKIIIENGFDVAAVITAPDKPAGRGRQLKASAVKKFALENGIPVLQPTNLKDPGFIRELEKLQANLQVVVAFRMLPEIVWKMPEYGTFNLHASLLPQYRGAAPINHAIINGETETGVTTFFLQHEIDTGSIIFSEKIAIGPDDNAGVLHDNLMKLGAELVLKTIHAIRKNQYTLSDQVVDSNTELKKAPKIFKEDCRIDWGKTGPEVYNQIRGLAPFPGAFTEISGPGIDSLQLKIYKSSLSSSDKNPEQPEIITDNKTYLAVLIPGFRIDILELQLSGKKRMSIENFLRGFQIDERFTIS